MKNHELSKTMDELQKVHESTLAQLTEVLTFKLVEKAEFLLESST